MIESTDKSHNTGVHLKKTSRLASKNLKLKVGGLLTVIGATIGGIVGLVPGAAIGGGAGAALGATVGKGLESKANKDI